MYLIEMNALKDIDLLKRIYTGIDCFRLGNIVFVVYRFDLEEGLAVNKKLVAHLFIVECRQLAKYPEMEIEEFLLDLVEMNANVVFDFNDTPDDLKNRIKDMASSFGIRYMEKKPFDFDREVDLRKLTFNDFQIILEIMGIESKAISYTAKDFMARYMIHPDGKVFDRYGNAVADLNKDHFVKLIFYPYPGIDKVLDEDSRHSVGLLKASWYDPCPFLFNDDENLNKRIVDYKYRVFEELKDIRPSMYPELQAELAEVLNKSNYICFDDIMSIINCK